MERKTAQSRCSFRRHQANHPRSSAVLSQFSAEVVDTCRQFFFNVNYLRTRPVPVMMLVVPFCGTCCSLAPYPNRAGHLGTPYCVSVMLWCAWFPPRRPFGIFTSASSRAWIMDGFQNISCGARLARLLPLPSTCYALCSRMARLALQSIIGFVPHSKSLQWEGSMT